MWMGHCASWHEWCCPFMGGKKELSLSSDTPIECNQKHQISNSTSQTNAWLCLGLATHVSTHWRFLVTHLSVTVRSDSEALSHHWHFPLPKRKPGTFTSKHQELTVICKQTNGTRHTVLLTMTFFRGFFNGKFASMQLLGLIWPKCMGVLETSV